MGFVDLVYTAFLMPVLIVFPTNNTMYYWGSAVNLVLGGEAFVTGAGSMISCSCENLSHAISVANAIEPCSFDNRVEITQSVDKQSLTACCVPPGKHE